MGSRLLDEGAWCLERRTGETGQKGRQFNCRRSKRIGFARDISLKGGGARHTRDFWSGAARFYTMDKKCPICFGIGWVCENHPDRAWDREQGCECGAGIPRKCNDADEPDTSGVLTE